MPRVTTVDDLSELLADHVANTYGNHLGWGGLTDHEFDEGAGVWTATVLTEENIWQEDYELIEHEVQVDAEHGFILRWEPLGTSTSAADLYADEVPDAFRHTL